MLNNSFIIHGEKTKEITTVKEVWKCDNNIIIIKFGVLFKVCFEFHQELVMG